VFSNAGTDSRSELFEQNWGGVDWTALYPRDITIEKGNDLLRTEKIRPESNIRQVYTTCCYTPMFRFGGMSVVRVLLFSFRIAVRQSFLTPPTFRL
jgi:hypothetical protein